MIKQGLIISIDYTDTYCQVCYYSMRHNRPESVTTGSEVMRYLIPTALTYDMATGDWLIGNNALESVQLSGAELYSDFLDKTVREEQITLGDKELTYQELFAIYLGKMIEMVKTATAVRTIYDVTVNLRKIDRDIKLAFTATLEMIGVEASKVKFLCCAESFAYYILNEDPRLWKDGALLFDFSEDGFYVRLFKVSEKKERELIFVEETDCNTDFSLHDLASEIMREQLDDKLNHIFEDIYADHPVSSVYFAGSGFNELWFSKTLENISEKIRAFKGNNLYVKGACLAGYRIMTEQKDYPIISKERTKIMIHTDVKNGSDHKHIILSEAAVSWHDAGCSLDLIPDNASWITLQISSVLRKRTESLEFDLEEFPKRPNKATRIQVRIRYLNESECEIAVKDLGFGEFFPSSGKELIRKIDVDDYI